MAGCITYGDTIDEAIAMAKEAIELFIEELNDRGEEILDDNDIPQYLTN